MNTYLVTRPYCHPTRIIVLAETKKEARKLCLEQFGYAGNTAVKLLEGKGIKFFK